MKSLSSHEPLVSIVLPLFGSHRAVETAAAVCKAWLDQDVPCEVVLATATKVDALRFDDPGDERLRILEFSPGTRSLSALRNAAAAAARAPMLYLGDGDIVPLGRSFVRRALEVAGCGVLTQPWMYRVVGTRDVSQIRVPNQPPRQACFFRAAPDGHLLPIDGELFGWHNDTLWVRPPPGALPDDPTSMRPRVPFHWGGVILPRRLFEQVGGYCERYIGWGGEDDDLLFKLASRATLTRAWRAIPDLTCLHVEHPRPPVNENVERNRRLLAERMASGATTMIDMDVADMRRRVPMPDRGAEHRA